jgi:hypothetical protein
MPIIARAGRVVLAGANTGPGAWYNWQMQHPLTRQEALELIISNSLAIEMNAGDTFFRSTAMSVTIYPEDLPWVAAHVQRWGQDGVDSALAYAQNLEPLPELRTPGFEAAMADLLSSSPAVAGDVDHAALGYSADGPYRRLGGDRPFQKKPVPSGQS